MDSDALKPHKTMNRKWQRERLGYYVDSFGYPEKEEDWNVAALQTAVRIGSHRHRLDIGALLWWKPGVYAIFGNRGYSDGVMTLLRHRLEDEGYHERGLAVTEDKYYWVMLVEPEVNVAQNGQNRERDWFCLDDMLHLARLSSFVTEAVRIDAGIAFDGPEPWWELYKAAQMLLEPKDAPPLHDQFEQEDEHDQDD